MDIDIGSIEGATELFVMKDGDPPVSISDVGIPTEELNVAPLSKIGHTPKGRTI